MKLTNRVKWMLSALAVLVVGSIVYIVTLTILEENEIGWQYPIIGSVILILIFMLYFYLRTQQLETHISTHCGMIENKTDAICTVLDEPLIKVDKKA